MPVIRERPRKDTPVSSSNTDAKSAKLATVAYMLHYAWCIMVQIVALCIVLFHKDSA